MAKPLTVQRAVDNLPAPLREKVLDMMINHHSSRNISAFLSQQGHSISFANIARYKRFDLPRRLDTARKLQQINALEGNVQSDQASLASVTNAALAADPLMSRLEKQYDRFDDWYVESRKDRDFKALSGISRAEIAALTLHANLTGRLQQTAPSTVVQIVIGGKPAENVQNSLEREGDLPGETIDIG